MLTGINHSLASAVAAVRRAGSMWWGGIGCRVAFVISLSIVLVAAFMSALLVWEGNRSRDLDVRGRASLLGRQYASLVREALLTGDRDGIVRIATTTDQAPDGSDADLLYLLVYGPAGAIIAGRTPGGVITQETGSSFVSPGPLDRSVLTQDGSRSRVLDGRVYDYLLPVSDGRTSLGFVRVGLSLQRFDQRFPGLLTTVSVIVTGILLLGLMLSRSVAAGIVKPIEQLSSAVEELSTQNRIEPIPVHGRNELSRLASAFNQMALTLKQRESSLSRGNRDLFLLHTAGLDLMESLDLQRLLEKIAERATDLIKADTTTVAAIDRGTKLLAYLGAQGGRAQVLRAREQPLEAGGIYNWLVSYGTPLLIQDAGHDFRLDSELMASLDIRSLMTVPLWSSNRMIAILTVVNKQDAEVFDKHDLRLFTVFSGVAGAALQNAFLYADLKHKMEELHSTQRQLLHSTKLAAIGELATNLAHEINNPLTSVLGYTSHLIKTSDIPEEAREKLRLMERETLRVRKIIRNLLDFSRRRATWMRPGDLLQPLRETVALLQGLAERASVRIVEDYPSAPVMVTMDSNELKQVFLNIMNNALQAMPDGGELRVGAFADGDGETAVEIRDTGHGIAREDLGRIFEPFFSTKSGRDGTGLGLSISHQIVQNHGGRIEVESVVGRGTLFRIALPAIERQKVGS